MRETLFNWLGQDLAGRSCLDLFAGAGALGFEALSRGASAVTMIERNPAAWRALRENAARLGADRLTIEQGDALQFLVRAPGRFDVIFLDPPFRQGLSADYWARLPSCLAANGVVYLEADSRMAEPPLSRFEIVREGRAGSVHYHLIGRNEQ